MSLRLGVYRLSPWPRHNPKLQATSTRQQTSPGKVMTTARLFHSSPPQQSINTGMLTPVATDILESIHAVSGLSWGLTITLSAVLIRGCFSPLTYQAYFHLQDKIQQTDPLREAFNNAWPALITQGESSLPASSSRPRSKSLILDPWFWKPAEGQPPSPRNPVARLAQIHKDFRFLSPVMEMQKVYSPLLFTFFLPVWCGCINALWHMCSPLPPVDHLAISPSPTPIIASEGFLWMSDLAAPDPSLCIILATLNLAGVWSATYQEQLTPAHLLAIREELRPLLLYAHINAAVLFAAASGLLTWSYQVPAAAVLFACSCSSSALFYRRLVNQVVRGDWNERRERTPVILPARGPRRVVMSQKVITDSDGTLFKRTKDFWHYLDDLYRSTL